MNDQHIDDLLDQDIPPADANARKIAINSASQEFSQAFAKQARPISERGNIATRLFTKLGNLIMPNAKKPVLSNTFASIAVAFIALSVFFMLPEQRRSVEQNPQLKETPRLEQSDKTITQQDDAEQATNTQKPIYDTRIEPTVATQQNGTRPNLTKDQDTRAIGGAERDKKPSAEAKRERNLLATAPSRQAQNSSVVANADEAEAAASSPRPTAQLEPTAQQKSSMQEVVVTASKRQASNQPAPARLDRVAPMPGSRPASIPSAEPSFAPAPRPDLHEEYAEYQSNSIVQVAEQAISTFSIDVDTASYALVRTQLQSGYLPNPQAVRAEELINYFSYDYPLPKSAQQPFQASTTVMESPWTTGKKLIHIGIQGYQLAPDQQPDSNIVFLLDVSGSMNAANKLPLVKQSIGLLLDSLKPSDTVSIAVYAGAAGTVLEPTKVADKAKIIAALNRLSAGGSTAGGAGIELAYNLAEQSFNKDAVNRIVLATDGDFNVGLSSNQALQTLVERKRDKGVFLSVLGFGRNNYQDDMMQTLAQNGNGVAAYIDTLSEAKKVLVDQATSTLFTIAKDVKLQLEFNPATVSEYRLIGYETRALKREDFNNDKVDAGDIGAGHRVTAIYEIAPINSNAKALDTPRYSANRSALPSDANTQEYGFLKIRYKQPDGTQSKLLQYPIAARNSEKISSEAQFSIAVAGFAQLLSGSNYTGEWDFDEVIKLAQQHKGNDPFGYRSEFIQLVRMAKIAKP